MFIGSYNNTLDTKGRAFIPSKMRFSLGERIMLVKGIDDCLYIFTTSAWEEYTKKYIENRSMADKDSRKLARFFLGNSKECEIDKQGRINFPADHLLYAEIDKDIVFVGCGDLIEVWDKNKYDKEMSSSNLNPDELMQAAEHNPQTDNDGV